MLKTLVAKQLREIFRAYFYNPKKNTMRSKAGVIAYMVLFALLMVGLLGGMFAFLGMSLCGPLYGAGLSWLYFDVFALLAVFLGVFGSVFNTYSGLYLAKDNDLLLSMPIPVGTILASRLLSVYVMGALYSAVVILPGFLVYWITVPQTVASVLAGIWYMLLLSGLVLILSCLLGYVVAQISRKLKNKSFITVLASLAFMGAYYFFYFRAQTILQEVLANAAYYGQVIQGKVYPLYLFGCAAVGNPGAIGGLTILTAVLLCVTFRILTGSFLKIATSTETVARIKYRKKQIRRESPERALLRKDMGRFLSSPNYMLNCGMGCLMLLLAGGAMLLKRRQLAEILPELSGEWSIPAIMCGAVCLLASMNDIVAPSVSLESQTLWLLQSLPVTPWKILRAKIRVQLLLTLPLALAILGVTALVYPYAPVEFLAAALQLTGFVFLMALLGMTGAVLLPNLTWTSELTPIKQSASVALTLLGGMLLAAAPMILYLAFPVMPYPIFGILWGALQLLAAAGFAAWLKTKGAERFAEL